MSESKTVRSQKKTFGPKPIAGWGTGALIKAVVRWDDECGNGRNSFSVTGEIYIPGRRDCETCGCIHEAIAAAFPELAHLIKWHLFGPFGPPHYIANVLYLAGDRDCWGLRKGEVRQIRNGKTGLPAWELVPVTPVLPQYVSAETKPEGVVTYEYRPWNRIGEGKEREFDSARRIGVWPDATDETLSLPPEQLKPLLEARLPALLAEMEQDVVQLGFTW